MKRPLPFIFLFLLSCSFAVFFLIQPSVQQAGDVVEYYGITQSLITHQGLNLTSNDELEIKKVLHPEYFNDPGYYLVGKGGFKYPVHFVFYSVLVIPFRLILEFFHGNALNSLTLLNVFLVFVVLSLIIHSFIRDFHKRLLLIGLIFLSPLIFFFAWPGPDAYYFILTLLAVYLFGAKKYWLSGLIAALASWHSQPLMVMSAGLTAFYLLDALKVRFEANKLRFELKIVPFVLCGITACILAIPYIYNYLVFGLLTPWTIFSNGWTQFYGFGIQNISALKLFEQLFDLNMGLFWHAPLLLLLGFHFWIMDIGREKRSLFLLALMLVTALFYQTNPAWHFGTAGYGPTRHIIFALPFFIYFIERNLTVTHRALSIFCVLIISQLIILSFNGGILPNFEHTLYHSVYAKAVLNNYPYLYNPTPEIFVDRTNHTDLGYLTSAVYKNAGACKKAFVLQRDKDLLTRECGFIPLQYEDFFDGVVKIEYPEWQGIYVNYLDQ